MGILLLLSFFVGIILLCFACRFLSVPLRFLWKLVLNALLGAVVLVILNFVGGLIGLSVPITPFSALIAGVFGAPGVLLLVLLQFIV